MTVFTVLGLSIFIFFVLFVVSILLNVAWRNEIENSIGFLFVLVIISILIAIFIAEPQVYGYEKITVSENSIEKVEG